MGKRSIDYETICIFHLFLFGRAVSAQGLLMGSVLRIPSSRCDAKVDHMQNVLPLHTLFLPLLGDGVGRGKLTEIKPSFMHELIAPRPLTEHFFKTHL